MTEAEKALGQLTSDIKSGNNISCDGRSLTISGINNDIRWALDCFKGFLMRNNIIVLENVSGFEPKYFPDTEVVLVFINYGDNFRIGVK